ncbi:MAG: FeoA domain-containing protein [Paracoccaceae bacterium]|jgi:Fe2+ transport system protein FeoA
MTLSRAAPGHRYHLASLGETRADRLELMAAGLSLESAIQVLAGGGKRPRVVACGEIRAAIGHDLAERIQLRRCGCGCGCDGGKA